MSALKLVTPPNPGRLSLKAIKVVPELFQTRVTPDPETGHPDPVHVLKYYKLRQAGSEFPALVVYLIDGVYYLVSGHTRFAAAWKLWQDARRAKDARAAEELATVPVVVKEGTMTDALVEAVQANLDEAEARPFKEQDRMHAVEMMIRNGAGKPNAGSWDWPDAKIGFLCKVSPATVKRSRLSLQGTDGVPLPERVRQFGKDGNPKGKTHPYSQRPGGSPPLTPNKRGFFYSTFNGKREYFGRDQVAAVERQEDRRASMEQARASLSSVDCLRSWLIHRGILAESARDGLGALTIGSPAGGVIVVLMAEPSLPAACEAVGRAVLSRHTGGFARAIICGYARSNSGSGIIAAAASRLDQPIEFMAPEEIVAEFGPAGGTPDTPADTAADAEGGDDDA